MEEDLGPVLLVSWTKVIIKNDNWGHSYLIVRGETSADRQDGGMESPGAGRNPCNKRRGLSPGEGQSNT